MIQQYPNPPHDRLLALPQVLAIIPVSKSTFWLGVKNGRYPKPQRISVRRVAWRESEILSLVSGGGCDA